MWNLGDMFDAVAEAVPGERQAIVQGDKVVTWAGLVARTNRLARAFIALGMKPGARVAILSRNDPAYIEAFVACLKARLSPVNINYRYQAEEVAYVLGDCDARVLIYQSEFAPQAEFMRRRFAHMQLICIGGGGQGALDFEEMATTGDASALAITRSPDDPFLLYTGGTTGRPKGVVWPGNAVRSAQMEAPVIKRRPTTLAEHVEIVRDNAAPGRVLPACPLMHGAGINATLSELISGGTGVILSSRGFDPAELWSTVARHRVSRVLIVGDVFARPMLRALDEAPGAYDLGSLKLMSSAGLMWSREIKQGLLRHMPWITLLDVFGASEAAGLGYSMTTKDHETPTGRFDPGPKTVLLTDEGALLRPGTPGDGMVARSYPLPLGYLGDPKKTAEVFRMIDGERYAVPGDWARFFADGSMELVGRGNLVINTGGEKVFVEEVEEALKLEPGIDDALVVGLPDATWGNIAVALVTRRGADGIDEEKIKAGLRARLANYKIPKAVFAVAELPRAESGKGDYSRARALAVELMRARDGFGKSERFPVN